jgi:hypothetical protein
MILMLMLMLMLMMMMMPVALRKRVAMDAGKCCHCHGEVVSGVECSTSS